MIKSQLIMNTWAVIKTGGKQYKVSEGQTLVVEKLNKDKDSAVTFGEVLAVRNEKGVTIGLPLIDKAKVTAKVVENTKDDKIKVVKFKSKSRYLRTYGHRQLKTKILIEKILS